MAMKLLKKILNNTRPAQDPLYMDQVTSYLDIWMLRKIDGQTDVWINKQICIMYINKKIDNSSIEEFIIKLLVFKIIFMDQYNL